MENITYRDQVIWGTSLSMAKEDEIELCYGYVKESVERRRDIYYQCKESISTKTFIGERWQCDKAVHSSDLCSTALSIKKEDVIAQIERMVSDDITVSGEEILKAFKNRGYIDIYKCDRVFFKMHK